MPDFSKKTLVIVVSKETDENGQYDGLIYHQKSVFAKINVRSEEIYHDFFNKNPFFSIVSIETEMGPGELKNILAEKDFCKVGMHIGGIIAPIKVKNREKILSEVQKKIYQTSKEKKIFGKG